MRIFATALAVLALLPASAEAAATVSGTLTKGRGYTVIALAPNGQSSKATIPASGRFALKIPAKGATLQLVAPNGAYFGPVTLGKVVRKKVNVALSGKAVKLGKVALGHGFATAAKAPKKAVSAKGAVKVTKRGAPLGAGNLGFVKVAGAKGKVRTAAAGDAAGADPDGDGVPNTFDSDDNGNQTLDGVDPSTAKTASTAGLFSDVQVMMSRSVNANAGGISRAQVDAFVKNNTSLNFYLDPALAGGGTISSVDVDCGTLAYCRPGDGYALMGDGGNSPTGVQDQRWVTFDQNHDGFPDVPVNQNNGGPGGAAHSIEIRPEATTTDLHAGDLYQVRFTTPSGVRTVPTALGFYFVSNPTLASYDGGAGTQTISYPANEQTQGSDQNPLLMSGDKITLTFWRPQRAGFGTEPAFVDMGHLRYGIPIAAGGRELSCPAGSFTGLSPTLSLAGGSGSDPYNSLFPLQDSAGDGTPSVGNALRVTFDVGGCMRANGIDPTGQQIRLPLEAVDQSRPGGTDRSAQTISVCLPGCTPPASGGPGGGGPGSGGGTDAKPDLVIDSASGTDNGGSCQITAQLANRGTAQAGPTDMRFQTSDGGDVTVTATSVPAGETRPVSATVSGACAGRTYTVTADSGNTANEYTETNNTWSGSF